MENSTKNRAMKIVIVVLNWNGGKFISKCLDSLKRLEVGNNDVEVVIVDNASADNSVAMIKKQYPQFHLINNSKNLGYAEGNNVGIRLALGRGADWIWVVNPDIEVRPDSLKKLIEFASGHPKAGILGSKVYFAPGFEFHKKRYKKADLGKVIWYAGGRVDWDNIQSVHWGMDEVDSGKYDTATKVGFVTGASMLLRNEMLGEVGLLDSDYFLYFEENDLCQKAVRFGWELWYVPQSIVWHANAQSTVTGSNLVDYYTTRNRMLFGMRWAPLKSKLALLRESLQLVFRGRLWQKRGIADFYLGRFGKGSHA